MAAVGEETVLPLCSNTGPDVRMGQSLAVLAMVGLTSNGDPEEECDEDWSLDPWLYEVRRTRGEGQCSRCKCGGCGSHVGHLLDLPAAWASSVLLTIACGLLWVPGQHMDDSDEFTSELSMNGEPVPVTTFLDPAFEWPREGTMTIVYTYFSDRDPMSATNYAAIIQEARFKNMSAFL